MSENINQHPSFKGVALLRDELLPNLLKEDQSDILYWAGKDLARSYKVDSVEEIVTLMTSLSFGALSIVKQKKSSALFLLHGEIVHSRLQKKSDADFSLETGFLAQMMQQLSDYYTEGSFSIHKKNNQVEIVLQSDRNETVS